MDQQLGDILRQIDGKQDKYIVSFGEDWLQGRSAFGGLSTAILTRAMRQHVGEDSPMRSLLTSFIGPTGAGEIEITVEVLRVGKNVQHVTARTWQNGQVCTQVAASFGGARESIAVPSLETSPAAARDSVPALPDLPILPKFLSRFDIHWTGEGKPMTGKKDRNTGMWARCSDGMTDFIAERLVALADVPPPVTLSWFTHPVAASSVTWSLEFVKQPSEITGEWFYMDYDLEAADHGYCQQSGKVFDENGQLVMVGRQCMAFFA